MVALSKKQAKKVEKAEAIKGGNFEPLTPGKYIARLSGVVSQTTNAGDEMWVAEFQDLVFLRTREPAPGRQWLNINLPVDGPMPKGYTPKNSKKSPEESWDTRQRMAEGGLKAFFDAFGVTADTDTEDLVDEHCLITVGVRTIQQGARRGEKANQVNGIEPLPDDVDPDDLDAGDDADDDDDF